MVDSCDGERLGVAKQELLAMLEEEELKDAILLVFANKQDSKGAYNAQQVSEALSLPEIRNRQWSIQETSAPIGAPSEHVNIMGKPQLEAAKSWQTTPTIA